MRITIDHSSTASLPISWSHIRQLCSSIIWVTWRGSQT